MRGHTLDGQEVPVKARIRMELPLTPEASRLLDRVSGGEPRVIEVEGREVPAETHAPPPWFDGDGPPTLCGEGEEPSEKVTCGRCQVLLADPDALVARVVEVAQGGA
jgi:hypothetical protein